MDRIQGVEIFSDFKKQIGYFDFRLVYTHPKGQLHCRIIPSWLSKDIFQYDEENR